MTISAFICFIIIYKVLSQKFMSTVTVILKKQLFFTFYFMYIYIIKDIEIDIY